ncbi:uncharacterized protein VTP21DRAFT_1422 [Calcarisporiella thermophila]|uniref:uncharacterized protein n=1 Tax=Calcarisporiella thermophila TaxID=911321 RepID=UPI0037422CC5
MPTKRHTSFMDKVGDGVCPERIPDYAQIRAGLLEESINNTSDGSIVVSILSSFLVGPWAAAALESLQESPSPWIPAWTIGIGLHEASWRCATIALKSLGVGIESASGALRVSWRAAVPYPVPADTNGNSVRWGGASLENRILEKWLLSNLVQEEGARSRLCVVEMPDPMQPWHHNRYLLGIQTGIQLLASTLTVLAIWQQPKVLWAAILSTSCNLLGLRLARACRMVEDTGGTDLGLRVNRPLRHRKYQAWISGLSSLAFALTTIGAILVLSRLDADKWGAALMYIVASLLNMVVLVSSTTSMFIRAGKPFGWRVTVHKFNRWSDMIITISAAGLDGTDAGLTSGVEGVVQPNAYLHIMDVLRNYVQWQAVFGPFRGITHNPSTIQEPTNFT